MEYDSVKTIITHSIASFPFYVGGFYGVLYLLGIKQDRLKRSLFLAAILMGLSLLINLFLRVVFPIIGGWSPIFISFAFAAILPKYLTLRPWLTVAIPFAVYMFGNIGIILTLMAIFNLFAT